MLLIFGQIQAADTDSYVLDKMASFAPEEDLEAAASRLSVGAGDALPIVPDGDIPALSEAEARDVSARKICALRHLKEKKQLADGEEVVEDRFTYLASGHSGLDAGTPVLVRKTNMATLYYAFDNVVADMSAVGLRDVPLVAQEIASYPDEPMKAADPVSGMATALANALLEKLGAAAWEAAFPPKTPNYFQEVYARIAEIVKQELTEQNIALISGAINGNGTWLKYEYIEIKKGGETPEELLRLLRAQSMDHHRQISTLFEDAFKLAGLQVFLIAGAVHLALRQEMAIVLAENPGVAAPDAGEDSSYGERYATHIEDTFERIKGKRAQLVSIRTETVTADDHSWVKYGYYWLDALTGKQSKTFWDMTDNKSKEHPGRPKAEADRQAYLATLNNKLAKDLGDPLKIAKAFRNSEITPPEG